LVPCETPQHDLNGGQIDPSLSGFAVHIIRFAQLALAIELAKRSLHDPAFGLYDEATSGGTSNNVNDVVERVGEPADHRSFGALVGPD